MTEDNNNNNNNNNINITDSVNLGKESDLNIYVNEPIPILPIPENNQCINTDEGGSSSSNNNNNNNDIIANNPNLFLEKFKIIDIRPMGSGAKLGHGFSIIVPNEINYLISQDDFSKFMKSFNRSYNYFYLLLLNSFFMVAGIIFPIFFVRVSLLWAVIGGVMIISLGALFHFIINKYVKSKRILKMEKKVRIFNAKMDCMNTPLQFCLMRVQEAVPGKPHFSVERLIIRITFSDEKLLRPIGVPEA